MNCTEPPLTTVRQPIEPMARMVIELLVGQMTGTPSPTTSCCFEPELRASAGSTGPVRADGRRLEAQPRRLGADASVSLTRLQLAVKFLQSSVESCTLRPSCRATLPPETGRRTTRRGT